MMWTSAGSKWGKALRKKPRANSRALRRRTLLRVGRRLAKLIAIDTPMMTRKKGKTRSAAVMPCQWAWPRLGST